jgi:hypothetical protein
MRHRAMIRARSLVTRKVPIFEVKSLGLHPCRVVDGVPRFHGVALFSSFTGLAGMVQSPEVHQQRPHVRVVDEL